MKTRQDAEKARQDAELECCDAPVCASVGSFMVNLRKACAHHRILKPARTIAALEACTAVRQHHIMEAPACRNPARLPDIVTDVL